MIKKDNFPQVLKGDPFNFTEHNGIYTKHYGTTEDGFDLEYNALTGEFIYPEGVDADRNTTKDEHQNESYVVFLCVAQLFQIGYLPKQFKLEGKNYIGTDKGYCDILIKDYNGKEYAIIECKTSSVDQKDDEFRKHWKKTLNNGDQLFRYFNTYRAVQYLCMYTADYPEYTIEHTKKHRFEPKYQVISLIDNDKYLETDKSLRSYQQVRDEQGGFDEYFDVWKNTYKLDSNNRGLLEEGIEPLKIGEKNYSVEDLDSIDEYSLQKKYNEFAEILRKYTISSHENAFDKLVNLFLSKIIDEKYNGAQLKFLWKGASCDDVFSLQDRLNVLYRQGMKEFFGDDVTYVDKEEIEDAFRFLTSKADAGKETIRRLFRELKYFNNNPFAFLDVHNESLFFQNSAILREVIKMLQDIYLTKDSDNQFLGDLFEGFLNQGVHQSEGQFFTPLPIVRFLITSLPLQKIIEEDTGIPKAIDFACGAGHFLTEYARQIAPFVKNGRNTKLKNYYEGIEGIEKDYRLSKVSQVSAFMYNMDGMKIHYADGLSKIENIADHEYSVLVANPPYSVKGFLETLSDEELEKYTLTKVVSDFSKNNSIETFFVERSSQLLKTNGVAAIVLPISILEKGGIYTHCREIILQYFDIIAIAKFGKKTFGQTNTVTCTLFLRRRDTETEMAVHIRNRINAWFNGIFDDDSYYGDANSLSNYAQHIGIDTILYKQLLIGNLTDELCASELVTIYSNALFSSKSKDVCDEAKNIRTTLRERMKKKTFKNLSESEQKQIKDNALLAYCRAIEKDKLYYYLLAVHNPQVLIITSPSDNDKEKQFLGYEWSNRKGNEGIKYFNVTTTKSNIEGEENDDTLQQLKGISGINTPLFNPNMEQLFVDENKLNTLIRHHFNGEPLIIPDILAPFAKTMSLTDMIDFNKVEMDKAIKTTTDKKIEIVSKYPLVELGTIAEVLKGKSITQAQTTEGNVKVVAGGLDYAYMHNVANRPANTITISASGANAGFVNYWNEPIFASDCTTVRGKDDTHTQYLYNFLLSIQNQIYYLQKGAGQPHVYPEDIKSIKVPDVSETIQQQIVSECAAVDEEYNTSRMSIEEYKKKIAKVFADLEVISSLGGGKRLKMSELCESYIGLTYRPEDVASNGVLVLRSSNIQEGLLDLSDQVRVKCNVPQKLYVQNGDVLVCVRNGSKNLLGKAAYIDNILEPMTFGAFMAICRGQNGKWIYHWMQSEGYQEQLKDITSTMSINQLTQKTLLNLSVPVPSKDEQQHIITEIEGYESAIAQARSIMVGCAARKQAILDKYLK